MSREQIHVELQDIFRDIFDDDGLVITGKTSANDIEDWDSLAHVNLIVQIEKHFNVKFSMNDVMKLINVEEILNLIERLS